MFQLTETAAQELKKIKDQLQEQKPGSVPRLVRTGETEFKLAVDAPADGDQELYSADEKVLVVDAETSGALTNVTMDFKDTSQGQAFVFELREA
ncbi:MAG: hypothetical protein ACE5EP_02380 [Candidatus Methylomirabilales bacterium]